jgi:hypothetical protein
LLFLSIDLLPGALMGFLSLESVAHVEEPMIRGFLVDS